MHLLLAFALSTAVAGIALWHRSLAPSGAVGAVVVGTATFACGGWAWGLLLVLFFVTSSALSHFREGAKRDAARAFEKGNRRDLAQVVANGGFAAALAVAAACEPWNGWFVMFVGTLAAVAADTWATELGVLNPSKPRLITSWNPVEMGTSGAISVYGTLAALGGAFLIALLGGALGPAGRFWANLETITVAGLLGALFDSFLGATVQAIYHCPQCDKETERHPLHTCGTQTVQIRGWRWLNNDLVNTACATVGALIGLVLL